MQILFGRAAAQIGSPEFHSMCFAAWHWVHPYLLDSQVLGSFPLRWYIHIWVRPSKMHFWAPLAQLCSGWSCVCCANSPSQKSTGLDKLSMKPWIPYLCIRMGFICALCLTNYNPLSNSLLFPMCNVQFTLTGIILWQTHKPCTHTQSLFFPYFSNFLIPKYFHFKIKNPQY